jgi:hypothetical protein
MKFIVERKLFSANERMILKHLDFHIQKVSLAPNLTAYAKLIQNQRSKYKMQNCEKNIGEISPTTWI